MNFLHVNALQTSKYGFLKHIIQRLHICEYAFVLCLLSGLSLPAQAAPLHIVVFGDSLTSGYQLQPDQAFPGVLEQRLKAAGFDVKVTNMSLAGETSTGGRERIDSVIAIHPDIVILELGANDALRGIDPYKITYYNLHQMMSLLNSNNISPLLVGMKAPPNMGQTYGQKFDAVYERIHTMFPSASYYPFFLDGIVGEGEFNLADGYHPNANGVKVIVNRIYPIVDRLVRWRMEYNRQIQASQVN